MNAGPAPAKRENSSYGGGRGGNSSYGGGRDGNSSFGGARGGRSVDSSNRVYVGNLSWGVDDLALKELFSEQGNVVDAKVVYDRDSGRSRGFGFVTYSSSKEVNDAIDSLNGVVSIFLVCLIAYLDSWTDKFMLVDISCFCPLGICLKRRIMNLSATALFCIFPPICFGLVGPQSAFLFGFLLTMHLL